MRKSLRFVSVSIVIASAMILGVWSHPSFAAESAADFYAKNTLVISVPASAGGGTDFSGRLLASYWHAFTGGSAVVKNKPGGGGLEGTNFVWNAKPNGLTIGTSEFSSDVAGPWLFKEPGVQYDLSKLQFIGQQSRSLMVASIGTKASVDSIEGLQKMRRFKFGARGPRGNLAVAAALTAYFLNLKEAKVVTGYGGTSEIILAMKRGEVDGYANSGASTSADLPKGAVKKVVVALAPERAAEFPDVPAIGEIITLTSQQKKMLDILQVFSSSKVFFAAPGVPQDRIQFLRQKFIEILSSRGYLRQAKLRWPVWTKPVPGDVLTKKIMALADLPKSDLAKFEEILKAHMSFR